MYKKTNNCTVIFSWTNFGSTRADSDLKSGEFDVVSLFFAGLDSKQNRDTFAEMLYSNLPWEYWPNSSHAQSLDGAIARLYDLSDLYGLTDRPRYRVVPVRVLQFIFEDFVRFISTGEPTTNSYNW